MSGNSLFPLSGRSATLLTFRLLGLPKYLLGGTLGRPYAARVAPGQSPAALATLVR